MSFLKISGLVIGTGSVVGGTGAGIYYAVGKNNENIKIKFDGKLVFEKKNETNDSNNYVIKLLTQKQYSNKEEGFNKDKTEENKYAKVNKVIDISYELNISEAETKLKEIFGEDISLTDAKNKVSTEKADELKNLFGETIYTDLKSKLGI